MRLASLFDFGFDLEGVGAGVMGISGRVLLSVHTRHHSAFNSGVLSAI